MNALPPKRSTGPDGRIPLLEVHDLKKQFPVFYDDSGAIGRRYRRMDEAGTPFCITVDGDTAAGQTVTIRARDAMTQERVAIAQLGEYIGSRIRGA